MDDVEFEKKVTTPAEFAAALRMTAVLGHNELNLGLSPRMQLNLARIIERGLEPAPVRHVFVEPAVSMTAFSRWIWFAALWLNVLNLIDAPVSTAVHLIRTWVASW